MTQQQIDNIIERYPNTSTAELAAEFGLTIGAIYRIANKYSLRKTREYVVETARKTSSEQFNGRFQKGHVPKNKGKKIAEYMSPEGLKKFRETQFQKGGYPWNHKQIGYERKSAHGYIEVKVAEPNKFKMKHRIEWEKVNGPIPRGFNIQFKDGNRLNCNLENLYIISRGEQLMTQNSLFVRYPPDVQSVILAKAALSRQINKRLKEDNDE